MPIYRGSLATAVALVFTLGLCASAQDSPKYEADIRDQFRRWLDPKLATPNVASEETAKLEGINPLAGVLNFRGRSIVWIFEPQADRKVADRGEVKRTLEGMLRRYLDKQVEQALETVSAADRPQLLADLRSNSKVEGFDPVSTPPAPKVAPLASSQIYPSPQMSWPGSTSMPVAVSADAAPALRGGRHYIARGVLIRGKVARDWESLFNRGHAEFQVGRYRQAGEYFAAAAELGDDSLAWDFLALSSLMNGEHAAAREAARYSAARMSRDAEIYRKNRFVLAGVNGAMRDRLWQFQQDVNTPAVADAILAARPKLIPAVSRDKSVEVVTNRTQVDTASKPLE